MNYRKPTLEESVINPYFFEDPNVAMQEQIQMVNKARAAGQNSTASHVINAIGGVALAGANGALGGMYATAPEGEGGGGGGLGKEVDLDTSRTKNMFSANTANMPTSPTSNTPNYQMTSGSNMPTYAFGGTAGQTGIEVEGQELLETPGGQVTKVQGPSHEAGGVEMQAPVGTKVYSKRLKVQGKTMAERKEIREQKEANISSQLSKQPTDAVTKATLKRIQQQNQMEEELDLQMQESFAEMQEEAQQNQMQEYATGTGKEGVKPLTVEEQIAKIQDERLEASAQQRKELKETTLAGARFLNDAIEYIPRNLIPQTGNLIKNSATAAVDATFPEEERQYIDGKLETRLEASMRVAQAKQQYSIAMKQKEAKRKKLERQAWLYGIEMPEETKTLSSHPDPKYWDAKFNKYKFTPGTNLNAGTDGNPTVLGQGSTEFSFLDPVKMQNYSAKNNNPSANNSVNQNTRREVIPRAGELTNTLTLPVEAYNANTSEAATVQDIADIANNPIPKPEGDGGKDKNFDFNMPSAGDMTGLLGTAFSSFAGLANTANARAADTPNINAFENYGQDALDTMYEQADFIRRSRDAAKLKVKNRSLAQTNSARNTARGVNTLRALDLANYSKTNDALLSVDDSFMNQMAQNSSAIAGRQADNDLRRMSGRQMQDAADRADLDAFYTAKGKNLADVGEGIQRVGKMFNQSKYNKDTVKAIGEGSQYFVYDADGNLVSK